MALNDKDKAKIEKLKGKRKPLKEKEEYINKNNIKVKDYLFT